MLHVVLLYGILLHAIMPNAIMQNVAFYIVVALFQCSQNSTVFNLVLQIFTIFISSNSPESFSWVSML